MAPCSRPPAPSTPLDRLFTTRLEGSKSLSARGPGSSRAFKQSSSVGAPGNRFIAEDVRGSMGAPGSRLPSRGGSRPISRDDTRWHPRPFSPQAPPILGGAPVNEVVTLRPDALSSARAPPSREGGRSSSPAEIIGSEIVSAPKTFRPKAADITGAPWPEEAAGFAEGWPNSIADRRASWRIKAEIPTVKEFPHRRCLAWCPPDPDKPPTYVFNPIKHSVDKFTVNEFGEMERSTTDRHTQYLEPSIKDSVMFNRQKGVVEYVDQTRITAERWNPLYHEGINNHERLFFRKSGATTNFVDVMIRQGYNVGQPGR